MRISDWSSDVCSSDLISVGVLLLVLGLARASWALTQRPRRVRHVGAIGPLVTAGHFLLYASMLLMPVAGLMLLLGKGYGLTVFGLPLVAKTGVETGWMAWLGSFHSTSEENTSE